MATAEGEPNPRLSESYITARNDFFHRIVKWFYKDPTLCERPESQIQAPDFALFVCLLQAIGFDLHRIESLSGSSPNRTSEQSDGAYSVSISCANSGLCAVLRSRSQTEESAVTNTDPTVRQANIQDLLPAVAPGTALVATDVISQLIQLLSGVEEKATGAQRDYNWTCSRTVQQQDMSQCRHHRSLDTFLPVDSSTTKTRVQPQNLSMSSELMKMEPDNVAAAMSGCKKVHYSYPSSPVLSGNSVPKPELIRQKTWSIGSIQDLEEAPGTKSGPPLTSSPLQSQQSLQNMEQLSLQYTDTGVADRLQEACAKIQEVMSMLSLSQRNKETGALQASKCKAKQVEAVAKLRSSKVTKSTTMSSSDISSNLGTLQRSGTVKRQRTPAPRSPLGRRDISTPKPVKRSATQFSTPAGTPHAPRKTKENEFKAASFMNIPEPTAGSPNVSQRTSSSAPDPQVRENISPTGDDPRPNISRRNSKSSLPTSLSTSNIPNAFSTPRLRGALRRTILSNATGLPSASTPNILGTPTHTNTSNAPRKGSNSVLRPSLLKTPSIINRFKK